MAEHGEEGVVGAGDAGSLVGVVDTEDVGLEQPLDLQERPLGFQPARMAIPLPAEPVA